jgi:hypothetical protein
MNEMSGVGNIEDVTECYAIKDIALFNQLRSMMAM